MELTDLRNELDLIDREIVSLFEKRMGVSRQVALYKIAHDLPVLDSSREDKVLESRMAMTSDPQLKEYISPLYKEIMRLSRALQEKVLMEEQHS